MDLGATSSDERTIGHASSAGRIANGIDYARVNRCGNLLRLGRGQSMRERSEDKPRPAAVEELAVESLTVREMAVDEVGLIINYFHQSTPEHLEILGVDPTRLATPDRWRERYVAEYKKPAEDRATVLVVWELDGGPVGFSTADKIVYGEQAHMHLHVIDAQLHMSGIGSRCVPLSVDLYFDRLRLKRLFCEPNAFNVAPNRLLHRAGFRYVKTHMTVPGPLNYHQAVTRWVFEK
jgi:RimJ/RimL family protein N-acetyltransferase